MRTILTLAAFVLFSACSDITGVETSSTSLTADQSAKKETAAGQQDQNLVDIATGNPAFSILVDALSRVDLVGAVAADDVQYTVFAPTNDAFVALLGELGAASLDDIDDATLTAVLLYHVVEGRRFSNSVLRAKKLSTLNGGYIMVNRGTATLTDANGRDVNIVTAPGFFDIPASNGVVHVIDRVLLP